MIILLYDGSMEGFFSAVFEAYRLKAENCSFCKPRAFTPRLFDEPVQIHTRAADAKRVLNGLAERLGKRGLNIITRAFLSEEDDCENTLYRFIRKAMQQGRGIIDNMADPDVLAVSRMSLKTSREYHRFLGLIRFRLLSTGEYYAGFEPDTNLVPLLGRHFAARFPDQAWMIHDRNRDTALVHIEGDLEIVNFKSADEIESDENADKWTEIWKIYHRKIGIDERANPDLQRQFMPKKHWRYLPEMN